MNDLISRQAAIKALDGKFDITGLENAETVKDYINGVDERLRRLPSAEPEIIRCKDCKYSILGDNVFECFFGFLIMPEFYCGYAERIEDV